MIAWMGQLLDFYISTHAPLAGRDDSPKVEDGQHKKFQPTRPLRGATKKLDCFTGHGFISTHAPLAGRDNGRALMMEETA